MTRKEKETFVHELVASVQANILANIDRVPEEWDGIELREWIADRFADQKWRHWQYDTRPRLKAYRNEVLVRNL
jgi:hypothetical protein